MPNVGRPSRDCHLCRQRRVKVSISRGLYQTCLNDHSAQCDLRHPECERCIKLGKQCPGYRDESDSMFRVEDPTSFAAGVNRDHRRKRGGNTTQSSTRKTSNSPANTSDLGMSTAPPAQIILFGSSSLDQGPLLSALPTDDVARQPADSVVPSSPLVSPSLPLVESWETHVIPFCLDNLLPPRRQQRTELSFLAFLPDMVAELGRESPVGLACQAISWAFLASRTKTPEATSKRAMSYGQALTSTNAALREPFLQTRDDTLASVWLLSLYEVRLHHPFTNVMGSNR